MVTSGSRTRIRVLLPLCRGGKGLRKRIMISEILIIKFMCHVVELGTADEIY